MLRMFLMALCLTLPLGAAAQTDWNNGSYWAVTSVDTHPTKFDDYIRDLDSLWRRQMDMLMEEGKIKSYRMFSNVHARQGEPDLWLFVEYSSAGAMLDTPQDYWQNMMTKLTGGQAQSESLAEERGDIRTIMSSVLLREISFK